MKLKICAFRAVLIFLILCFVPIHTYAETVYTGYKLNTDYELMFVPYQGFGTTTIAHFNEALYEWNSASGITLMRREPTLRHSDTNYPSNDNKSYIYKTYDSRGYIGATKWYTSFLSKTMKSIDINFNTMYSFSNSASADHYDAWSVFVHEAGHAAGLNDLTESSHSSCVMYYNLNDNTTRRYLTAYDRHNIQALY